MNFLHIEVELGANQAVEVTLRGVASHVYLFDAQNFLKFKNGQRTSGFGGYFDQSPAVVAAPRPGHWNLVIYPAGTGTVSASYRIVEARAA